MVTEGVVRAHIDPFLKSEATAVLDRTDLSVSDAFRMMLTGVDAWGALQLDT
jgi:DNA-damage-inducible protein J